MAARPLSLVETMPSKPAVLAFSLALLSTSAIAATGTSVVPNTTPSPERLAEGCTAATGGAIRILPVSLAEDRFAPDCLVAERGEDITFENRDLGKHDPGDGREDVFEQFGCFKASFDVPGLHDGLPSGDTYTIELRFDETTSTLFRGTVRHNGDVVRSDVQECRDHAWEWRDASTIAIPYICHIHPSDQGQILLEV